MGKGDKKTRRGKLFMGSFGKKRPKKLDSFKAEAAEKVVKVEETKPVRKHVAAEPKAPKTAEAKPVREKKEDKPEAKKEASKPKKEKKAE